MNTNNNDADKADIVQRPGWREAIVALIAYVIFILLLGTVMYFIPEKNAVLRINIGGIGNGLAAILAFLAAYLLKKRSLNAYGFRRVESKWVILAIVFAIAAFFAVFGIEAIYFHFVSEPNNQIDFQIAAKNGFVSLSILLFTGALVTPFAEELIFRGIIANMLNRYNAVISIISSATIFGLVHGFNVIFFDAFLVGVLNGFLFRKSNSIWPSVVTHVVYNSLTLIYYSIM